MTTTMATILGTLARRTSRQKKSPARHQITKQTIRKELAFARSLYKSLLILECVRTRSVPVPYRTVQRVGIVGTSARARTRNEAETAASAARPQPFDAATRSTLVRAEPSSTPFHCCIPCLAVPRGFRSLPWFRCNDVSSRMDGWIRSIVRSFVSWCAIPTFGAHRRYSTRARAQCLEPSIVGAHQNLASSQRELGGSLEHVPLDFFLSKGLERASERTNEPSRRMHRLYQTQRQNATNAFGLRNRG